MDEYVKKSGRTLIGWIIFAAILGFAFSFVPTRDPYTLEDNIQRAHEEYAQRALGYRSSFLPRKGPTKGDDYANCVLNNYNRQEDAKDFCLWHAELGPYKNRSR